MAFSGHYCFCGLEAKYLNPRCEKHKDKPAPKKKTKRTPFSGASQWREDNQQFQALEGR
jgi:hypothetical protein